MGRRKRDNHKTKAQLVKELTQLRERVAELEAQASNQESNGNTSGSVEAPVPPTEMQPLHRIAEQVEQTLRPILPEEVDIRLCTEERLGLVHADPGVSEQLVVHLFLTRSKPRHRP